MLAQSTRGKARREETRVAAAHIYALAAADMPPGALRNSKALRQRLLDFVNETQAHCLALSPAGAPQIGASFSLHDATMLGFGQQQSALP